MKYIFWLKFSLVHFSFPSLPSVLLSFFLSFSLPSSLCATLWWWLATGCTRHVDLRLIWLVFAMASLGSKQGLASDCLWAFRAKAGEFLQVTHLFVQVDAEGSWTPSIYLIKKKKKTWFICQVYSIINIPLKSLNSMGNGVTSMKGVLVSPALTVLWVSVWKKKDNWRPEVEEMFREPFSSWLMNHRPVSQISRVSLNTGLGSWGMLEYHIHGLSTLTQLGRFVAE